jgi:hypothetical protein
VTDVERLRRIEDVIDASGQAPAIEARLPSGGRPRQLNARTLLVGILLATADDRPLQLVRVHEALTALRHRDMDRLGVVVTWRRGPHLLTYRQVERTFCIVVAMLDLSETQLFSVVDALVEASVPAPWKDATTSYSVDWTDHATWSKPVAKDSVETPADTDAGWGHRKAHAPGDKDQLVFGYYAQAVVMAPEEDGPKVPELVRRITLDPPRLDPATQMAGLLRSMAASGVAVRDVLADSGYAHRSAERWATPLRLIGARLVQDLHPHDRGQKGAFDGAVCASGSLYCPATPKPLLALGPPSRRASAEDLAAHDERAAELARWRLSPVTADDADGYHRVACPAAQSKLRCPLKPASMALGFDRPEVTGPPVEPPRCCAQATITVPPSVNAKSRQKHPYPSAQHRQSYARRTGSERAFATLKDSSSTDVRRGSCRMMGRTKNLVMLAGAVVVRNMRITDSFEAARADDERRARHGQATKTRRRRRQPLAQLPVHDDVGSRGQPDSG